MGIVPMPRPVVPSDPDQRKAYYEAVARQVDRDHRNPFEQEEPLSGWGLVAFLALACGGFGS